MNSDRNSKRYFKSKQYVLSPQPQQKRYLDNDSNSSTQISSFSEYANDFKKHANKAFPPNYPQMSFSNELKLESKIRVCFCFINSKYFFFEEIRK